MKVNKERLARFFTELCETDSPSRHEAEVAKILKREFQLIGADEIIEDNSAPTTGADCGNLIIRFSGDLDLEPIFISCHMDTVEPARGVKVQRTGDIFTSSGETILGSDDKSGLAACIEVMRLFKEHNLPHRPVDFVITTCEEIGLIGAKALDPSLIKAKEGYALDSSGFARVIIAAPAANRLSIIVKGIAAHAGLHPEWGVNAIALAAQALAKTPCGRIDQETTANFGTIQGGAASNIVAEEVTIEGEVRSHSIEKLAKVTEEIRKAFTSVIEDWQDPSGTARGCPSVKVEVREDFPVMQLTQKDQVIQRVDAAARSVGIEMVYEQAGGGSDANIFNGLGLPTAIVATGMTNVHSTDEQVDLNDMVALTRLLAALLTETSC